MPLTSNDPLRSHDIGIYEYLSIILRRRKTFILTFLVVFISVALYTFIMTPIYEASALLHVKEDKEQKIGNDVNDLLSLGTTNPVNAELEILKSRTNAEHVVKNLHLDWEVAKKSEGLNFKLIKFSSNAEKPVYWIKLTGADTFTVKDDDGKLVGEGKSGHLMQTKDFILLLNDLKGEKGESFRLTLPPFDGVVDKLRKKIKAVEVGRMTNIIKISYQNTDTILARDIVNTLIMSYLEQNISFKAEEAHRTVDFVEDQIQGVNKELDRSEKDLQVYKSSSGVISLDTEAEALIEKITGMEKAQADVSIQKKQVEFALDALKQAMRKGTIYSPSIMRR
jgi:tyrosine-protein kinase Etk/Wzc